MKLSAYRLVGGLVLIGLGVAAFSLPDDTRKTVAVSVSVISLFLLILSRVQLGASFSVRPKAKALVVRGLYSRIQHPLYFFLDTMLWGVIVYLAIPWLFVLWAVLLAVHVSEARREERLLESAFGDAYTRYQSRTWF